MPHAKRPRYVAFALTTAALAQLAICCTPAAAAQQVSFSLDVLPIIESHCVKCHHPGGPGHEVSGLDLRNYEGLMKGTQHGKIITPGEPLTSNLLVLIEGRADPSIRMPHHERPLLKQQVEILREWVKQGAQNN